MYKILTGAATYLIGVLILMISAQKLMIVIGVVFLLGGLIIANL